MKNILIIILSILFISCSSPKRLEKACSKCPSKDSTFISNVEYIEKIDTFYITNKDSSNVKLTIDCDSLFRPRIITTDIKSGVQIKTVVTQKDTLLNEKYYKDIFINSKIDSQKIAYSYYNNHKKEIKNTTKTIQVFVEKKLTKLQKLFLTLGKIFAGALLSIFGYFILLLIFKLK